MKKLIAVVLCLAMVLLAFAGCASEGGDKGNVIKIGVFEPTTGENGAGGMQEVLGARYANKVKPTVTINGTEYKIELVEADNQSDKTAAVTAAQSLVSAGVIGVIGSYGSGVSIAAGPAFEKAKIPAIGCSCTNPQVTAGKPYYFRVCFLDPYQGEVMANFAYATKKCVKAAVITQNGDDYSTGLGGYFKDAYVKLGGELVYEGTYNTNESDFNAILTAAKAKNPDVLFIPSSINTAGLIIKPDYGGRHLAERHHHAERRQRKLQRRLLFHLLLGGRQRRGGLRERVQRIPEQRCENQKIQRRYRRDCVCVCAGV